MAEDKEYVGTMTLGVTTDSQDAEHTYEGLIRSFEYFGGVPDEVLVDNQKTAVLEHGAGERPTFNAHFLDLADHYGVIAEIRITK